MTAALLALYVGVFSNAHPILVAYPTKAGCVDSGGTWLADSNGESFNGPNCELPSSDDVKVERATNGKFKITASVSGRNAHECDFEGEGRIAKPGVIIATEEVDDGTCKVTLTYKHGALSLNTDDRCDCPSGTWLTLDNLKRVSK